MKNTYYGIEKLAGLKSELVAGTIGGSIGPAGLAGMIAAAATPTFTEKQMKTQGKKTWSNLIPGVGTYRLWKRLGYSQKAAGEKK